MSTASEAPSEEEQSWRRRRSIVALLTFIGVVLLLLAVDNDSLALTLGLPAVAAVTGLVLSRARPASPVGAGMLRGAGMLLVLYATGLVLLLLSLAG